MKLIHLYFVGIFIAIGVLVASASWQYRQFQTNIGKLSVTLPQNIQSATTNLPDLNSEYKKMLDSRPEELGVTNSTSTKEFQSPDKKISFSYSANWQETKEPLTASSTDEILFYAYKIADPNPSSPAIDYLIVKSKNGISKDAAIAEMKKNIWAENAAAKISEYEIQNQQQQPLSIVEFSDNAATIIPGLSFDLVIKTAVIESGGGVYYVSVATSKTDALKTEETDKIFSSIIINGGAEPAQTAPSKQTNATGTANGAPD